MKGTGQGVLKWWCYEFFDRFQRYVKIVRKSAITLLLKAQVECKVVDTTLQY